MVSTDKHSVLVQVGMKIDFSQARAQYGEIRGEVQSRVAQHHRHR